MPVKRGRIGLKEKLRENAIQMRFLASASPRDLSDDAKALATVPADPAPVKRPKIQPTEDSESTVQDECINALMVHPKVGCLWRQNNGAMTTETSFVRFITIYGKQNGEYMKPSDLGGFTVDGRIFAVEVKHRHWRYTGTAREKQQKAFHSRIKKCGGLAGFACCAEDAVNILEGR